MQCWSCGAAYANDLEVCPHCQRATLRPAQESPAKVRTPTLIPFPGVARVGVPHWRQELSQRVRELQERRTHEAATEGARARRKLKDQSDDTPILGLVPQPSAPSTNPIVKRALRRIERARQTDLPPASKTSPATANAPASTNPPGTTEPDLRLAAKKAPAKRLGVVAQRAPRKSAWKRTKEHLEVISSATASEPVPQERKPRPVRTIADGQEDVALSYLENYFPAPSPSKADRAPLARRMGAGVFDLLAVALLSSPFAGVMELARFNWSDLRLYSLMIAIVLAMMFLYLTVSTALTGRTLGMKVASIKAVDVRTGLIPSGGQSARRAVGYILSLATLGLGFAYALLDAHGRTAYDLFSGTIVVRE